MATKSSGRGSGLAIHGLTRSGRSPVGPVASPVLRVWSAGQKKYSGSIAATTCTLGPNFPFLGAARQVIVVGRLKRHGVTASALPPRSGCRMRGEAVLRGPVGREAAPPGGKRPLWVMCG